MMRPTKGEIRLAPASAHAAACAQSILWLASLLAHLLHEHTVDAAWPAYGVQGLQSYCTLGIDSPL